MPVVGPYANTNEPLTAAGNAAPEPENRTHRDRSNGMNPGEPLPARQPRTAGVLLHPTSLPGTGGLGPEAYRLVDLLADAGQKAWQIMPVGPPGSGNSPYAARSAFAGDPMLISLEDLRDRGWLHESEVFHAVPGSRDRIDYEQVPRQKDPVLRRAFTRFIEQGGQSLIEEYRDEYDWLDEYALFAALRTTHAAPWWEWEQRLRTPEGAAAEGRDWRVIEELRYQQFLQLCFARQWAALKEYANGRGVSIIGDIPIFVDRDSADVWANQRLFKLDESGNPTVVAGVPPDAFSDTGQRWGNPVYDWEALRSTGHAWWAKRLARTLQLVDSVRLDHFRGFESTWEIPVHEPTAIHGQWSPGEVKLQHAAMATSRLPPGTPPPPPPPPTGAVPTSTPASGG